MSNVLKPAGGVGERTRIEPAEGSAAAARSARSMVALSWAGNCHKIGQQQALLPRAAVLIIFIILQ